MACLGEASIASLLQHLGPHPKQSRLLNSRYAVKIRTANTPGVDQSYLMHAGPCHKCILTVQRFALQKIQPTKRVCQFPIHTMTLRWEACERQNELELCLERLSSSGAWPFLLATVRRILRSSLMDPMAEGLDRTHRCTMKNTRHQAQL